MANVLINESTMTNIGNAIRAKTGKTDLILPANMASEIEGISADSSYEWVFESDLSYCEKHPTDISLPSIYNLRPYAFYESYALRSVSLPNVYDIGRYAFSGCQELSIETPSFIDHVYDIRSHAFERCGGVKITRLSPFVSSVGDYAFKNCVGLTTLTIPINKDYAMFTTIDSTAFSGCTNLKTINVTWSEGAVSGAPWGATNATINYNYTEE